MKREQTRVEPSRSLLQGAAYTHSSQTDISARFEAMRPKPIVAEPFKIHWPTTPLLGQWGPMGFVPHLRRLK